MYPAGFVSRVDTEQSSSRIHIAAGFMEKLREIAD